MGISWTSNVEKKNKATEEKAILNTLNVKKENPKRYRILLIGMPSSGRRAVLQYIKLNVSMTDVRWSDAHSYQELTFEYNSKHYVIIMDTRGAYSRIIGSYRDHFIPITDPMNCLHGIIFVVDAHLYNDTTNDHLSLYEALSDFPEFVHFAWEDRMYSPGAKHTKVALQNFAKSKLFVHEVLHSVLSCKLTMESPFLIYANKMDKIENSKESLLGNIKENLVTSRNLCNFKNTLLKGIPMDIVDLIVEYVPGITDEAISRPFKVFNSIATPQDSTNNDNEIKKGFEWLITSIAEKENDIHNGNIRWTVSNQKKK